MYIIDYHKYYPSGVEIILIDLPLPSTIDKIEKLKSKYNLTYNIYKNFIYVKLSIDIHNCYNDIKKLITQLNSNTRRKMITKENLKEVLEDLDLETIITELDKPQHFVKVEVNITNTGSYTTMKSVDYNEEEEILVSENGDLYLDKESLTNLFKEHNIKYETETI